MGRTIQAAEGTAISLITLAAVLVIALLQKPFAWLVCFKLGLLSSGNKLALQGVFYLDQCTTSSPTVRPSCHQWDSSVWHPGCPPKEKNSTLISKPDWANDRHHPCLQAVYPRAVISCCAALPWKRAKDWLPQNVSGLAGADGSCPWIDWAFKVILRLGSLPWNWHPVWLWMLSDAGSR